jgi:YHS domain-containing protein
MLTRILLWGLLLLLIFRALGRLIRGIAQGADSASDAGPRRGASRPPAPVRGEAMVRDPVCGTYVVPSRAVTAKTPDGVQHFCSDACRQKFLAP